MTDWIHNLPDKPLVTTDEMASFLRVSKRLAQRLCQQQAVRAVKVGKEYRVSRESLLKYAGYEG